MTGGFPEFRKPVISQVGSVICIDVKLLTARTGLMISRPGRLSYRSTRAGVSSPRVVSLLCSNIALLWWGTYLAVIHRLL
jgi:hypothetical protein